MNKFCHVFIVGLFLLPSSGMSETYKCRSPDGKISYSGQMSLVPGVKCEQIFVKKLPVVVQEEQPAPPTEAGMPPPSDPRMQPPPEEDAKAPPANETKKPEVKSKKPETDDSKKKAEKASADKQAEQKIKEENCQSAQTNLRTYQAGGRISKVNEKGEKVYLDEAEVKQKADQAQKEVEKWCGA